MESFGIRLNAWIEKYLSVIVPVSLILGFLLSHYMNSWTAAVPLLFAYLTFVMATGCSFGQIREAFRMPLPMALTFVLSHVVAPALGYAIGRTAFGAESPYVVGFVLFAIIPLGVSSVIWVGLSKGHVPLALAMIVIDSALSPFVIPAAVELFFGEAIAFDHTKVMLDLVKIIVVPTILGVLVNELSKQRFKNWSAPVCGPTSKLALAVVVMINAAAIEPYVAQMKSDMIVVIPLVVLLVILSYLIGFAGSVWLRKPELIIAITYSSGMRNISLGLVLALAYFEPLTAVPVVLSILIQQPMATLNHWLMKKYWRSSLYTKLTGAPPAEQVRY
ncbi:bile acid:sodium symporter family protein [Paenibacillus oleatilyticus]|uniref:bile acid:sodium symporter family protein n=1 Tax=Paenibacillus oleatilyticus TaxID=2594886 RepID=UPI001C201229|nr:bile acid:sodium symporter [Paenibacillus oleatilyticus]MBU7320370.1 bile acid:sodium symporter [Paenibacillus oleatilyticus]